MKFQDSSMHGSKVTGGIKKKKKRDARKPALKDGQAKSNMPQLQL